MRMSNELRKKQLELRITKLSVNGGVNMRLIKKAERQLRKLS